MIMVQAELHGQGIGSLMLNNISEKLLEVYNEICLESFENNQKANSFYEKNGWKIDRIEFDEEIEGNRIYYFKEK